MSVYDAHNKNDKKVIGIAKLTLINRAKTTVNNLV